MIYIDKHNTSRNNRVSVMCMNKSMLLKLSGNCIDSVLYEGKSNANNS